MDAPLRPEPRREDDRAPDEQPIRLFRDGIPSREDLRVYGTIEVLDKLYCPMTTDHRGGPCPPGTIRTLRENGSGEFWFVPVADLSS